MSTQQDTGRHPGQKPKAERADHENVLVYRRLRYFKIALGLCAAAVAAYLWHTPLGGRANGGTWLGYTLGGVGAALILWLTWFGIRKRRYGRVRWMLEDWLSGHVYLGLSLVLITLLHAGFQVGWNVHTAAFALMVLVIASGLYGLYAALRYPPMVSDNRQGMTVDQLLERIVDLGDEAERMAVEMDDAINDAVQQARRQPAVATSLIGQLRGRPKACRMAAARELVERTAAESGASGEQTGRLLTVLVRIEDLLARLRLDMRLRARMRVWRFLHVPLTIALFPALAAHVLAVFFYW